MEIPEHHVVISHFIHGLSGKFISQKGWITFYKGIDMLLCEQIVGYTLDLMRRTSVERGDRGRITDIFRYGLHILLRIFIKFLNIFKQPFFTFRKCGILSRVHHRVNKMIDLL